MKSILTILFLLLLGSYGFGQGMLELKGKYQGKNLYIQNPITDNGAGSFCTDSVSINGIVVNIFIKASAFEIKLDDLGYKPGDSLKINIYHRNDCLPKVLSNHTHP